MHILRYKHKLITTNNFLIKKIDFNIFFIFTFSVDPEKWVIN